MDDASIAPDKTASALSQAELVDVDRDLRVEDGLQLLDQLVGERVELSLRQGAGDRGMGCVIHQANRVRVLWRASTNESASSRVLYRANEARALAVPPKRRISGSAQWVPARTAMP